MTRESFGIPLLFAFGVRIVCELSASLAQSPCESVLPDTLESWTCCSIGRIIALHNSDRGSDNAPQRAVHCRPIPRYAPHNSRNAVRLREVHRCREQCYSR
jgi:hypothetical protein